MFARREILIGQGLDVPDLPDEYYNLDDKFDTYSCVTGDYRATSSYVDTDSISITVDSDFETDYSSDTDTLISQASTPSSSTLTSTQRKEEAQINPVGVNNEHEGMNYELLMDGIEEYDYKENVIQTGTFQSRYLTI